jgi:hypothetical protein
MVRKVNSRLDCAVGASQPWGVDGPVDALVTAREAFPSDSARVQGMAGLLRNLSFAS